jgi:hypothetical protein
MKCDEGCQPTDVMCPRHHAFHKGLVTSVYAIKGTYG